MRDTVQPVQEFPCLYGDAQVEPPLPLTQIGVSSLVRGCRTSCLIHLAERRSVLACTGHPALLHDSNRLHGECPRLYGASPIQTVAKQH